MFAISQGLHRSAHLRGFGRDVEKGIVTLSASTNVHIRKRPTFFSLVLLFITGLSNLEHELGLRVGAS
jgi:hypothetical protein